MNNRDLLMPPALPYTPPSPLLSMAIFAIAVDIAIEFAVVVCQK